VVNTNRTSALLTTITIQGVIPAARAELKTITAPSVNVANDFSRPDAVFIQKSTLPSGRSFVVTFPKHSVSVIVLRTQLTIPSYPPCLKK
jgi:alpha-L-arabinofuranosidase